MLRCTRRAIALIALITLATLCTGATCRYETTQSAATTFFNAIAAAAAQAIVNAATNR